MISAIDIFSIGIGPSSSHTVGPMRAAKRFIDELATVGLLEQVHRVEVELFGSLGLTGIGHGTGKAVILGLSGHEPETVDVAIIEPCVEAVRRNEALQLGGLHTISFSMASGLIYHRRKTLPAHSNAMELRAYSGDTLLLRRVFYSIGGGFVVDDDELQQARILEQTRPAMELPYPFDSAEQLLQHCKNQQISISRLMLENETALHGEQHVRSYLMQIWHTMKSCIERGCHSPGILPGGLKLARRAPELYCKLNAEGAFARDPLNPLDWVDLFALAVSEENAAGGRVVTAPTNGAAGVIPAVMAYYDRFVQPLEEDTIVNFLLTAGAIGILYKRNASISGAEVGCQGEVGVACSMAAGALTEILGGSPANVENAAEIGMEHNLGLTCDPIGGLVQVPCIERNAMAAVKAINASRLALRGSGEHKVSLDKVIKTMRDTGHDMKSKYKETARGGLAVNVIEC